MGSKVIVFEGNSIFIFRDAARKLVGDNIASVTEIL